MEAIREYLSNLFLNLPETPQVLRAKAELMEMMEDKYEELIGEGMSEKEAVGTVISEFGNLEELAEELGIGSYIKKQQNEEKEEEKASRHADRKWGLEDVKNYLSYAKVHALYIAVGVMLCIWAPFLNSIMDGAVAQGYLGALAGELIGSILMFLPIGIAVVLFVLASTKTKEYGKISRYTISLDEEACAYIKENQEKDEKRRVLTTCIGIFLCIISVVPNMGSGLCDNLFVKEILDSSILLIVGIGVFLIVSGNSLKERYQELAKAVSNYEREQTSTTRSPSAAPTGNIYEKKKVPAYAIVLMVIFGVLVLSLGAALPVVVFRNTVSNVTTETTTEIEDLADVSTPIHEINVEGDAMELTMEVTDEVSAPELSYQGTESRKPEIQCKDGTIKVKSRSTGISIHFFSFGSINEKCSLTMRIPTSMYQQAKCNIVLDAGDVHLNGLPNGSLTVDLDAGNLIVSECTLDNIKVEADAGNVELKNNHINAIEAEVDAGNFEMDFDGPKGAYAYDLAANLGNVEINGEKHAGVESELKCEKDTSIAGYESYRQVKVDADLGNVEIRTK